MQSVELINKVAQSGILSFDLEEYFPKEEIVVFDLKEYLFRGLILKEKDFREALVQIDWKTFSNKYLTITCSADAIIPQWAYMLVSVYAQPHAKAIYFGTKQEALKSIYFQTINSIDVEQYRDQRVVVKGCSDKPVPPDAYVYVTNILRPVAKSIMYGEPCSTVPLFKRKEIVKSV
ncbi:MAG: DUF2480 family protein [Fimbriimonadaceae bacterium]|nr:DUF2480 family protein [Chitinophagales bacterium]